MRELVAAAVQAPSIHNTQPWRFVARADTVQVWADPARRLPVLDPSGRALRLSLGAAIALARTYAQAHGVGCSVVAHPGEGDHVADLVLSSSSGAWNETEERQLAESIAARHTDRRPFDPRRVDDEVLQRLTRAAEHEGAWVKVVGSPDEVAAVVVALAHGEEVLTSDPAYVEELQRWTGRGRFDHEGVPSEAVTDPTGRASSYRLRDFSGGAGGTREQAATPPVAEHPQVLVLGTPGDTPTDWLRAGQAAGRLLLTATTLGVVASPMTQALEVPGVRSTLTRDLGVVGHPQLVLRLGYPGGGAPPAYARRRPVDEVLSWA